MAITPKGISIQSMYKDYRENKFIVNRRYQRKLVWTSEEKQKLIDTVLKGFPIPLLLLAEKSNNDGKTYYEIIDGLQRLNAIFSYIENKYSVNNFYFNINELSRAKQLAQSGIIQESNGQYLANNLCADFLDYQLAVTIFPVIDDNNTTDVFNRINSGGKQLSNQERRQAGIITKFGEFVRELSSEIRGDVSSEQINLINMPEISIETGSKKSDYGLNADSIIWCSQGILWAKNLRDSEDEEMIADITASVLLDKPFNRSRERLDELYLMNDLSDDIENRLMTYGADKLFNEMKDVFSIFKEIFETASDEPYFFRNTVLGKNRNPAKTAFYTLFIALFELIVKEQKTPIDYSDIILKLRDLQNKLKTTGHYVTSEDRIDNINITKALINSLFVKKEPPILGHGPSLAIDLENSLRRSKIETSRYEFKQGIIKLDGSFSIDNSIYEKIIHTICAIANIGKNIDGYLYIGVADKKADNDRIKELFNSNTHEINEKFIVGIERECKKLNMTIEQYMNKLVNKIRESKLSEPLKTQILTMIDLVNYKGLSIIRIKIQSQKNESYYNDEIYIRKNNSTEKITNAKEIVSIVNLFR